jgi:hypothetical protein
MAGIASLQSPSASTSVNGGKRRNYEEQEPNSQVQAMLRTLLS